jgi:hypothetical protein
MDTKIDWNGFDGMKFQDLCGKLLALELLGNLQPNGALGKDQGIDASYLGSYGTDTGTWRFQFKFHNQVTSAAVSALKKEVREDIAKNLRDEDHIVFVTNTTLNPKQVNTLKEVALTEIQKVQVRPKVHIWDGAKLEGLLSKHPVLWKGYWGNVGIMFRNPLDHFHDQLQRNHNGFYNFWNPSYGRQKEFDQLGDFLSDSTNNLCTVIAPGGYGKTRLCIDFFIRLEKSGSKWKPYIVERGMFDANNFDLLLSGTDHLVLLIDDADKEIELVPMLEIARRSEYRKKIKVILTVRKSQFERIESAFGSHQTLGKIIELKPLPFEEAQKVIAPALQVYGERIKRSKPWIWNDHERMRLEFDILNEAKGVPLVLATYGSVLSNYDEKKAIFSAKDIKFSKMVSELINQELGQAKSKLRISRDQGELAMQIMALATPFVESDIALLIKTTAISDGKFKSFLDLLVKGGFVQEHDRNVFFVKRSEDSEYQPIRTKKEIEYQYQLIPDPYKDIIVAKFLQETKLLKKLIKGKFGTNFYRQAFQNILLSLDALEELSNDAIKVLNYFPTKIKRSKTTIELVIQILKDVQTLAGKIPGMGRTAFLQILNMLEEPEQRQRLAEWYRLDDGKKLTDVLNLTEDIFRKQIAKLELDDDSYLLLLRYCKAVGSWRLFRDSSQIVFVFGEGNNSHNADFLIEKAIHHLILQKVDVDFGLQFLAWSIGAYFDDNLKESFTDRGYNAFSNFDKKYNIPNMRWEILQFLFGFVRKNPNYESMVNEMCWNLLKYLGRYWYAGGFARFEDFTLGEGKTIEDFATKELLLAYDYLIEFAQARRKSIAFRDELWWKLHFLDSRFKHNAFATAYQLLDEIAEEKNSIGEAVVFEFLHKDPRDSSNEYVRVAQWLGKIRSIDEAIETMMVYFAAIDELPQDKRQKLSSNIDSVFLDLCKEAKINAEEFYELMFRDHREKLWQGRGAILDWIGFGERPNRPFFRTKAWELIHLEDSMGKIQVLQAYWFLPHEQVQEIADPQDLNILETIIQAYLMAVTNGIDDAFTKSVPSWLIGVINKFIYYDLEWAERMNKACYEAFPYDYRTLQMRGLLYIERQDKIANPFLATWILEKCWEWKFENSYDNHEELILYAWKSLSDEQVLQFLVRHLQDRHSKGEKDPDLDWTFLPLDPNNARRVASQYHSAFPKIAFEAALNWYFSLDFDTDPIIPADAWHLLRYFRTNVLEPEEIKSLFLSKAPTAKNLKAQFQFFAALMIIIEQADLVLELLRHVYQPFPRANEFEKLRERYPEESEARTWIRLACDYWEYESFIENPRAHKLAVKISFDLRLWLR